MKLRLKLILLNFGLHNVIAHSGNSVSPCPNGTSMGRISSAHFFMIPDNLHSESEGKSLLI